MHISSMQVKKFCFMKLKPKGVFVSIFPNVFPKFMRWSSPRLKGGLSLSLLAGRSCSVKIQGRTELCTLGWTNLPPVKCKISVNTHTVGDLADLQALLLDRKHFTCRFTGLPQRLYGSSREVTNIQTRGFPVMKVEPISRISRGGLILSTSPFRSQRSFTDFSMGFILAPSLFFGWKVAITWKSVVEEAWTPHRWRIVQSFNSERINPMCRPNYCPDIWKTAFSEIVGTKENLQLQSVAIK